MNEKKAKGIRKFLKSKGMDPLQAEYVWLNVDDGKPIDRTVGLHRDCGKRKYRQMKAQVE